MPYVRSELHGLRRWRRGNQLIPLTRGSVDLPKKHEGHHVRGSGRTQLHASGSGLKVGNRLFGQCGTLFEPAFVHDKESKVEQGNASLVTCTVSAEPAG